MNHNSTSISQRYKINNPIRNQLEMQFKCLDDLIPLDHKARAIWSFVEQMDVSSCFEEMLTYTNDVGRPATSPKVLLCLWIYSILDGNISARKLEELCSYHDAYKWIIGGTPVNRTMISEFRSKNPEKFEDLLISCLSVMLKAEVISDQDFSQDGTRVKANAGTNSFHREEKLKNLQHEVKTYIDDLEIQFKKNPKIYDERTKAANTRAAQDRAKRIDEALKNLKENRSQKNEASKKKDSF